MKTNTKLKAKKLLAIADDPSSLRIKLGNDKIDFLIQILRKILLVAIGNKTGRSMKP